MRKRIGLVAVVAVGALALSACGSSSKGGSGSSASSSSSASASGKVGVILPDATTSPRWESQDRPNLKSALTALGLSADIQNANGDKSKFSTICDSMINEGVKVLAIVNLDSETGAACLKKAQGAGIKTIDYDRLTLGGGASYYVSFDNVKVGELMGQGLQKCLTDAGKTSGVNIVFINGDPTDNNAALFKQGYKQALDPMFSSGKYKLVGDQTGKWDATIAGTAFENLYTANGGKIDGVVSANDTMAGGIIARLKANKLNGKIPVTGQDASKEGLQAILVGDQCVTIFKDVKKEAQATAALSAALIKGGTPGTTIVNGAVKDTVLKKDVPSALQTPVAIFKSNINDVITAGYWTKADICTSAYAQACAAAGIK